MSDLTDRGGAVNQDKNWKPKILTEATYFVHCGAAPFANQTTRGWFGKAKQNKGLLLKYAKEVCKVQGSRSTKFTLAFPSFGITPWTVPNEITLSKPAQLLWGLDEMPRGYLFKLPVNTTVYTQNGELSETREAGMDFDILFETFLVAQYQRQTKQKMSLVPLNGASWL